LSQVRDGLAAAFALELTRLVELATDAVSGPHGPGLAGLEGAVRAAMTALGGQLLERLLAADRGHAGPRVGCGAGHQAVFVGYRDKTIHTVLGPVRLRRAWYHCGVCRQGHAPLDRHLDVAGTCHSPGLSTMIDIAAAAAPFTAASGLLADLAGVTVGAKSIERVAEADGLAAQAEQAERTAAILTGRLVPLPPAPAPGGKAPDMLYVAIDGTGVPMRSAETEGRAGKHPDGRARTREVKLAALFTQTKTSSDGYPLRDPDSTSYLATFDNSETFGRLVKAAALDRGHDHLRQTVILGDGARRIWTLADTHFPAATQIVDLFHAREHLHDLAGLLAFITPDPPDWLNARLTELDNGQIEALAAAARHYHRDLTAPIPEQIDKAVAYFETNAHRMRYAHYRQMGMFIGSGVVEAGCKNIIGQRLKQSGMHWSTRGATGITTLRCQQASAA
jgi:hypothetical protein